MTRPLQVLAIDDDEGDAQLLCRCLEASGEYDVAFVHATTAERAFQALREREYDIVFLDYMLGAVTGLDVLARIRADGAIVPIIALTGQGDEYIARDLIHKGADDYIVKDDLDARVLRRAIDNALSRYHRRRLENENAELLEQLKEKNTILEQKNTRLAEMFETAHEFVDNVSHEFRTPLTVIREFTSLMNDGLAGAVTDEQREYLAIVMERVDDLAAMVDDLLDISKLEAGLLGVCRRQCSAGEIIDRVRSTLDRRAATAGVPLELPAGEGLPGLYCDPEKIGRVITNLTINAIKFSREGKAVRVWVTSDAAASCVRFGVTDEGPGIDPDKVAIIFDRFQQVGGEIRSSTKGFGLGLNIAKELVQLNFGDIDVTTEPGAGSTFSFTVPTASPPGVIQRYLDHLAVFRTGARFVSLLTVTPERGSESTQLEHLDGFILHQIRCTDMAFRVARDRWVLVAASNQNDLTKLLQRFDQSLRVTNRSRPGKWLPSVVTCVEGTWNILERRGDFLDAFHQVIHAGEPVHA